MGLFVNSPVTIVESRFARTLMITSSWHVSAMPSRLARAMNDLSIGDGNDREEPIVVGHARSQDLAVHLVFDDHNSTVVGMINDKEFEHRIFSDGIEVM